MLLPDTLEIPLSKSKVAIIDASDYEIVQPYSWYALETQDGLWYACNKNGRISIMMHRLILGATIVDEVDHVNNDGLDNRRSNIRLCSSTQNKANTRKRSGVTSRYKGVSWYKNYSKWRATISMFGVQTNLGYYQLEEDAARAYNKAAAVMFGEFARLNVVSE